MLQRLNTTSNAENVNDLSDATKHETQDQVANNSNEGNNLIKFACESEVVKEL